MGRPLNKRDAQLAVAARERLRIERAENPPPEPQRRYVPRPRAKADFIIRVESARGERLQVAVHRFMGRAGVLSGNRAVVNKVSTMNKPPAFQFYVDDYLGGTRTMNLQQKGAYVDLLCLQWSQGAVSEDDFDCVFENLDEKARAKVKSKFCAGPDGLYRNKRMEDVRSELLEFREKMSKAGAKGAESRWLGHRLGHSLAIKKPMAKNGSPYSILHSMRESDASRPSLEEVKGYAAIIGLAEWKAEDWFKEMEGCGWLDFNHRPVIKWQPVLDRVRTKWETDGRPATPPTKAAAPKAKQVGPTLAEVQAYAKEKWFEDARHTNWATSFYAYWNDPKRAWKRNGVGPVIDWKETLTQQVARWR